MKACATENLCYGIIDMQDGKELHCVEDEETLRKGEVSHAKSIEVPHIYKKDRYGNGLGATGNDMLSCEKEKLLLKEKSSFRDCAIHDSILIDLQRCLSTSNQSKWDLGQMKMKCFIPNPSSAIKLGDLHDEIESIRSVVKKKKGGDEIKIMAQPSLNVQSIPTDVTKTLISSSRNNLCSDSDRRSIFATSAGKESRSSLRRKSMFMEGNSNLHQNSLSCVNILAKDLSIFPMKAEIRKSQRCMAIQKSMSAYLIRIPANRSQNKSNSECILHSIPKRRHARSLSPTLSTSISDIKYENRKSQSDRCLCQFKKGFACECHSNENKIGSTPGIRVKTRRTSSMKALVTNFDKRLPIITSTGKESRTSFRRKSIDLSDS